MNEKQIKTSEEVFADPVTYLAQLGIEAEIIYCEELALAA